MLVAQFICIILKPFFSVLLNIFKTLIVHTKNFRLAHFFIRKTMKTVFFCLEKVSLTTKSVLSELHKTMPEIPTHTGPGANPASSTMGTRQGYSSQGVVLTTYPHLAPMLKKEQSYNSSPPLGLRGLFQGELYPYFMPEIHCTQHPTPPPFPTTLNWCQLCWHFCFFMSYTVCIFFLFFFGATILIESWPS